MTTIPPRGTSLPSAAPGALPESRGTDAAPALVSVVAPVYNEQHVVADFVRRLQSTAATLSGQYRFEFIIVDDGSRDASLTVARQFAAEEPRLRVLELRRNYGQTAALQAGLDAAQGDIVITIDADLQHFPEDIPRFLEKIEDGADVVCGWRHNRREGILRRWPSSLANRMIRAATGITMHDIGTTFRAYRTEIIKDVQLLGENHRFIPVFARKAGAKLDEVKIENIARPVGTSNYGIGRTLNVWLDLFFIYFYANYFDRPLRIFGKVAMALFAGGGAIIGVLGAMAIAWGIPVVYQRTGWIYLAALLILTATQILLAGIIAEVMVRIYYGKSSQHAPYRIRNVWTADGRQG
jgi:glycosyltransferase involved in cell wall biosynthesis